MREKRVCECVSEREKVLSVKCECECECKRERERVCVCNACVRVCVCVYVDVWLCGYSTTARGAVVEWCVVTVLGMSMATLIRPVRGMGAAEGVANSS